MKSIARLGICFMLVFILVACVESTQSVRKDSLSEEEPVYSGPPITLAILDFENNSITEPRKVDPLKKGLASMLATDLGNLGAVTIVERQKILSIIEELKLGQTGMIADDTAIQVGKMLGAGNIIFGSFVVLGSTIRIDVRIIETETSLLVLADQVSGRADDIFELESRLIRNIASSLKIRLSEKETAKRKTGSDQSFRAAMFYSQGLELAESGDISGARDMFRKALDIDPDFSAAKEKMALLDAGGGSGK